MERKTRISRDPLKKEEAMIFFGVVILILAATVISFAVAKALDRAESSMLDLMG